MSALHMIDDGCARATTDELYCWCLKWPAFLLLRLGIRSWELWLDLVGC